MNSLIARQNIEDISTLPVSHGERADSHHLSERLQSKYADRITGVIHVPGRSGKFVPLPNDLPVRLAAALKARGIEQLYSHQGEAWQAVKAGSNVVIVTPTASGKSLCYTLPVLPA